MSMYHVLAYLTTRPEKDIRSPGTGGMSYILTLRIEHGISLEEC